MKAITKSLLSASLALGVAAFAFADTHTKSHETLNTPEQFQQLKAGDKVIYACNQCQTATEVTIASPAQAMDHCKVGETVTCPACKMKVTVTVGGPPKNQSSKRVVTYTNAKGEECLFVAKVATKS